jgi:hypothetical protein
LANDILNIGSFSFFPLDINWAKQLKSKFEFGRALVQYIGTASVMDAYSEDTPEIYEFGVTITTQAEYYAMLDFWHERKGMHGKFWLKVPIEEFTLKIAATIGSTVLIVHRNEAIKIYQDRERIWIRMNNGDIITRQIQSIIEDEINDYYTLNLPNPLDRNISLTGYDLIGRLLLCRFDDDGLPIDLETNRIGEITFRVVELVNEYSEVI